MSTIERPPRGLFVTFEGPDGSGKSTQLRILAQRLRGLGYSVLETAEPGGTPIGMQIRRILLDPANSELSAVSELLLMFAARAQNVEQSILPALQEGRIVLSDRFTDSTRVYQGVARGLGGEVVETIAAIACRGLDPDLTICLDIDTAAGLERARARNRHRDGQPESRIDDHDSDFHRRTRDAYHELARRAPDRVKLIDGAGDMESVASRVWALVEPLFEAGVSAWNLQRGQETPG